MNYCEMNPGKALRVWQLRCSKPQHSWRALSEVICDEYPDEYQPMRGNQLHGADLCRAAMLFLGNFKDIKDVPESVREEWDT